VSGKEIRKYRQIYSHARALASNFYRGLAVPLKKMGVSLFFVQQFSASSVIISVAWSLIFSWISVFTMKSGCT